MKEMYLDANAHVPMSEATIKVYADFQKSKAGWGHPAAPAGPGQAAASALENARCKIASLLGCKADQIFFTSTCTQACEWGMEILKNWAAEAPWCSPLEHSAISQAATKLNPSFLKVTQDGVIDLDEVPPNVPIICTHVQNEIGTVQPITELKKATFVFSDMCQSPGKESLSLREMPVDIAVFGAHKFGGPAGVGILFLKDTSLWQEFGTGSRYQNDRPGTPDVASVVATAAALEETLWNMPERLANMKEFQSTLENALQELDVEIIGKNARRVPNTTCVRIPEVAFDILAELTSKGIYVGMGSACGSMHTGPSNSMKALGYQSETIDFLRVSQHGEYGKSEAKILVRELTKLIKNYRR